MQTYPQSDGQTDVVYQVNWLVTATDTGGNTTAIPGVSTLGPPDATFTPYSQLTQDEVIGWVKACLGPEQTAGYELNAENALKEQSLTTLPLPWGAAQ